MPTTPAIIKATEEKGIVTVKALIRHPMETGQRKDDDGKLVPIHFIKKVWFEYQGAVLMEMDWSVSIAKDPTLTFKTTALKKGATFTLYWLEHTGQKNALTATVN